jgi:hypothetical protein
MVRPISTSTSTSTGHDGNHRELKTGPTPGLVPVPDPTTLTNELVHAAVTAAVERLEARLDGADRLTSEKFVAMEKEIVANRDAMDAAFAAEQRRVEDLAELKKDYDKEISATQTTQLKATSDLVSIQLDKVTTSLSDSISKTADNIATQIATMSKRLDELEQFRYETGGTRERAGNVSNFVFSVLGVAGVVGLIIVDFLKR